MHLVGHEHALELLGDGPRAVGNVQVALCWLLVVGCVFFVCLFICLVGCVWRPCVCCWLCFFRLVVCLVVCVCRVGESSAVGNVQVALLLLLVVGFYF